MTFSDSGAVCSCCPTVELWPLSDKNMTFFEGLKWNRGSGDSPSRCSKSCHLRALIFLRHGGGPSGF